MSGCANRTSGTSAGCATCGGNDVPPVAAAGAWVRDATGRFRLAHEVDASVGQEQPASLAAAARARAASRAAYAIVRPDGGHAGVNVRVRPTQSAPIVPGADARRGYALLVRQTGVLTPDGEWWVITTPQGVTGFVRARHLAPAESSMTDFGPLASTAGLLDTVTSFLGDSGNLGGMVRQGWNDPAALGRAVGILERADRALAGVVSAGDAVARVRDLAQSIRARIAALRSEAQPSTGQGLSRLARFNLRNRLRNAASWRARQAVRRPDITFPVTPEEAIVTPPDLPPLSSWGAAIVSATGGQGGLTLRSAPSSSFVVGVVNLGFIPDGSEVVVLQTQIPEQSAPAGSPMSWWRVRTSSGVVGFIRAVGPTGEPDLAYSVLPLQP